MSLSLSEGDGPSSWSVALSAAPAGPLDVTLVSSDPGAATVAPAMLTFDAEDFAAQRSVDVTPVEDGDASNEVLTVTVSATGVAAVIVDVTVVDQD